LIGDLGGTAGSTTPTVIDDCWTARRPAAAVTSRHDVIIASLESLSSSLQLRDVTDDDFPATDRSRYQYQQSILEGLVPPVSFGKLGGESPPLGTISGRGLCIFPVQSHLF